MNKHLKIAAALLVALPTLTFAQVRTEQTFEKGWKFTREDSKDFSQQTYDDTNGNPSPSRTTGLSTVLSVSKMTNRKSLSPRTGRRKHWNTQDARADFPLSV